MYIALSRLISLPFISKWGMITILIPQIGGLSVLAWPVIRGGRWRDVCQDVGLTLGRQSWSNLFVGMGTYLSAFPVIVVGAIVALAMMAVAGRLGLGSEEATAPIHPIVEPILRGNWTARLQVLLVVVFAAVPEEIMFRGVLYRHLRGNRRRDSVCWQRRVCGAAQQLYLRGNSSSGAVWYSPADGARNCLCPGARMARDIDSINDRTRLRECRYELHLISDRRLTSAWPQ